MIPFVLMWVLLRWASPSLAYSILCAKSEIYVLTTTS